MKAEVSIPVALGTAAVVFGVYQLALPTVADVRAEDPDDPALARAERTALILSATVAGGIALLANDATPFIVGGLFAVLLSWAHRHANMLDPSTQRVFNTHQYSGRSYAVEAD